jgi:hypothetical protein
MAVDDVDPQAALPPQATGDTPAGAAANILPPPTTEPSAPAAVPAAPAAPIPYVSAQDALRQANYGDQGAANYQALVAAGQGAPQAAPADASALANLVPGVVPGAHAVTPGQAAIAGFLSRDPNAGMKWQAQLNEQQMRVLQFQREYRENASEFYATLVPAVFKQFPGRPDLAAAMLQRTAAERGLTVDPAVLTHLNQELQDGKITVDQMRSVVDDKNTTSDTLARLGTRVHAMFSAIQAKSAADEAQAKAVYAPITAAAGAAEKVSQATRASALAETVYDTPERQAAKQVIAEGIPPGDPRYAPRMQQIVSQLKGVEEYQKRYANTLATARAQQQTGVLKGQSAKRAQDYALNYDMARDVYNLATDPDIQKNNAAWQARVMERLNYWYGGKTPPGYDAYAALSALSGLAAVGPYLNGLRNGHLIRPILEAHGADVVRDPPDRVANKAATQMHTFQRNLTTIYDSEHVPEDQRLLLRGRPTVGLPGFPGGAGPGGAAPGAPPPANVISLDQLPPP